VPVHWIATTGKAVGDPDFIVSARDTKTNTLYSNQPYIGGPFVILAADAAVALPIINSFQSSGEPVAHRAQNAFNAQVARTLVVAPTIAMFRDSGESITRGYLKAAKIPDSTGDENWDERPAPTRCRPRT
jgi:hypothetical protein